MSIREGEDAPWRSLWDESRQSLRRYRGHRSVGVPRRLPATCWSSRSTPCSIGCSRRSGCTRACPASWSPRRVSPDLATHTFLKQAADHAPARAVPRVGRLEPQRRADPRNLQSRREDVFVRVGVQQVRARAQVARRRSADLATNPARIPLTDLDRAKARTMLRADGARLDVSGDESTGASTERRQSARARG